MSCLKTIGLVIALAFLADGAAFAAQDTPKKAANPVTLKPQQKFEKCMMLTPPQKLKYNFGTDKPVDFDIHYQKGDMVYHPVKEKKISEYISEFSPQFQETYCLAWENRSPSSDVQLDYGFTIVR